ncbi:MAG: 16S rRNA (uracil1498-N3)-methyltransferase [bacterium]|nr:MAG: 16S rRNA (uracil1498-N3)-methyltransferase [bacterium]
MSGHRFYLTPENFSANTAVISGDESHHLRKVLRLRIGDEVQVFDGLGRQWLATIEQFNGQNVNLTLQKSITISVESPLSITLIQGLIKGDRFDWVIQKAVELGVSKIQPLISQYTDFQGVKGVEKRLERWERIALEATKQSGRNVLTTICPPIEWSGLVKELKLPVIFFAEREGNPLSKVIKQLKEQQINSITVIVGSEGGWGNEELFQAAKAGFYLTTLGKRILRAETAGITSVALIQYLLGDLD